MTLAINLDLCPGRHGASARVELHEGIGGTEALVTVRGWIDRIAFGRLVRTLEDLAARGVSRLVLDASQLRHVDFSLIPPLVQCLSRFQAEAGGTQVRGLSHHLRDLFRLAGCEPGPVAWATHPDPLEVEPRRECAS